MILQSAFCLEKHLQRTDNKLLILYTRILCKELRVEDDFNVIEEMHTKLQRCSWER